MVGSATRCRRAPFRAPVPLVAIPFVDPPTGLPFSQPIIMTTDIMTTDIMTSDISPPPPNRSVTICPQCRGAEDWQGASWCPDCGYYPPVDATVSMDSPLEYEVPDTGFDVGELDADFFNSIPGWARVMGAGIMGILTIGLIVTLAFPESPERGFIALAMLAAGIITVFTAHTLAVRQALREDSRIRVVDAFISWMIVWQPTFRELPETIRRVCAFAWGVTMIVTATTVIGGINYSAPFQTELPLPERVRVIKGRRINWSQEAGKAFVQAATKGGTHEIYIDELMATQGATTSNGELKPELEQAIAAMAAATGAQDLTQAKKNFERIIAAIPKKQPIEAMIYGVVHTDGVATSFLFAGRVQGEFHHVAEIYADALSPENYQRLVMRLQSKTQEHPAIPSDREDVTWVQPILLCRLLYTKFNDNNTLEHARFDRVIKEIIRGNRRR